MDLLDRKLLDEVQKAFPLTERPYKTLGERLGLREEEVIGRLKRLKDSGILRQIGAIFNPSSLGHRSTLVAAEVPEEALETAAKVINSHKGVTHNYLRDHELNMWFTLVVPPGRSLEEEAERLCGSAGARRWFLLPVKRTFKIAVVFDLEGERQSEFPKTYEGVRVDVDELTKTLVKVTQEPLPLVSRPFKEVGRLAGVDEEDVLKWISEMLKLGVMRRFAGLVKHDRTGYTHNVMVAWRVEDERLEQVGRALADLKEVTHCYERKSYPEWPYNLYTMIHSRDDLDEFVRDLAVLHRIRHYLPLRTVKELKKVRLKLFWE